MSEIDYAAVLADMERRRAKLDAAISAVREIMGEPSDASGMLVPNALPASMGESQTPTSHAFFGMGIGDAAKKYLAMAKKPQKAVAIARALKEGGLINASPNFAATVATTLRREREDGTVVQLPDKAWGLAEWFPSGAARIRVMPKPNGAAAHLTDAGGSPLASEPERPS